MDGRGVAETLTGWRSHRKKRTKTMKFTLEIDLGNDAMQSVNDVSWALQNVCRIVREVTATAGESASILDLNGNRVGRWEFTES